MRRAIVTEHACRIGCILALGMLTGCITQKAFTPQDWALETSTAESREAHKQLADHYNEIAGKLDAQAEDERRILAQYMRAPHKFGKRFADLKAHALAEIRDLQHAAEESRKLAEYHRELAEALP